MTHDIFDISKQDVSDDTLKEIRRYEDRVFFQPRKQLYRINRDQAVRMVELGVVVSLGQYADIEVMKRQVAGVFDTYASIPQGAYYSWLGPLPEMNTETLQKRSTGTTPTDWISRKRYEGFVIDGLEFNFHHNSSRGGCMDTIDRCVEISWDKSSFYFSGITPKKSQSCFQRTTVVKETDLKTYIINGFNLVARGNAYVSQNRCFGGNLGLIPLTSYRNIASGEELVAFVERFLGFTEEMIPYSEEAYCLQAQQGRGNLEKTKDWSKERILQEIKSMRDQREYKERTLEICGQR